MKKKTGRPCKLSRAVIKSLSRALEAGLTIDAACGVAGISTTSFHTWKARADNNEGGLFAEFSGAVRQAENNGLVTLEEALLQSAVGGHEYTESKITIKADGGIEDTMIKKITQANGPLLLQILERKKPALWGRKDKLELSVDEPLGVTLFGKVKFGAGNSEEDTTRFIEGK